MNIYNSPSIITQNHELLEKYTPLITQLLVHRGIHTQNEAHTFLSPSYEGNHNPFLMFGIEDWVQRVYAAVKTDEHITIYADYDADGIPGSVVLSSLFDKINYSNYDIYIPHRHEEGYGLHIEALEKIKDSGTSLVITIDVGITAHLAALWARENNIDLIITDHHLPSKDSSGDESLPDVDILVNPKRSQCNYPDPMLCGCGVIFKCVQGFLEKYREEFSVHVGWEKWLLDMVGISTISDMVPLRDENRIFAYYGLKVVKKTKRIGLKTLLWNGGINQKYLNETDVAFGITPRINAASRMSHPKDALAVFLSKNEQQATDTVSHLNNLNNQRKKLVAQTMKSAYEKLETRTVQDVLVLGSSDWQAGILGLVASKLVEKYKIPVFIWSEENGTIKGSCRTYNGHHLVEIMSLSLPETFLQFGGHKEAAGFSCAVDTIPLLQERLAEAFQKYITIPQKEKDESIQIDAEITLTEVTKKILDSIDRLGPFGVDNPKPIFLLKNIQPISVKQFGKTQEHLEIIFKNDLNKEIRAITFFKHPENFEHAPKIETPLNLLAHIEYSVFMGKHELRLNIVDILGVE